MRGTFGKLDGERRNWLGEAGAKQPRHRTRIIGCRKFYLHVVNKLFAVAYPNAEHLLRDEVWRNVAVQKVYFP